MSEVTEVKAAVEAAAPAGVPAQAVAAESAVVAYIRANAVKAVGFALILGAVIGKFI